MKTSACRIDLMAFAMLAVWSYGSVSEMHGAPPPAPLQFRVPVPRPASSPIPAGMEVAANFPPPPAPAPQIETAPMTAVEVVPQPMLPPPPPYVPAVPQCYPTTECHSGQASESWWRRSKARKQATHWGYPEYFCEPPLGSSLYTALSMQRAEGQRNTLYVYDYDFFPTTTAHPERLNAAGELRLQRLAQRCLQSGFPLMVELNPQELGLSEQRRQFVVEYCLNKGLGLDDSRVILAVNPHVLRAAEASLVYKNLLQQTESRGMITGSQNGNGNSQGTAVGNAR